MLYLPVKNIITAEMQYIKVRKPGLSTSIVATLDKV